MKWPPVTVNGRIPFVEGAEATIAVVLLTLSDLQAQPFNDSLLSLGDVTFKVQSAARARIEGALRRLARLISVIDVQETKDDEGEAAYLIIYTDRETRTRQEVTANG